MRSRFIGLGTLLALLALLATACAEGSGRRRTGSDTGLSMDTGAGVDTGMTGDSGLARDTATTPDTTPPVDSGVVDTGTQPDTNPPPDTAPPDTGPAPECTSAADCADGLACNGVERCNAGRCRPGTPVACDDGIACTDDTCVEPGNCSFTPNNARCAGGGTCTSTGCIAACSDTPCRLVTPQCGCPAGQGCYQSGTNRACAASGTAREGAACTGTTSCEPGNICLNVSTSAVTPLNICSRHCTSDADCAANDLCIYELDNGSGGSVPGVMMCTHPCDLVAQTGCGTGTHCEIFQETMGSMRTFTDCTGPAGSRGQGSSCFDASDCRGGFACIDAGLGNQCLHWCDVATGSGCTGFATCIDFTTPLIVNGREVGVCT